MKQLFEMNPTTLVIIAAIIGYVVVSKLYDFFKKGSAWEEGSSTPAPDNPDEPEVLPPAQNVDPAKRQQEEYKRFLEEEKKRQRGEM